MKKKFALLTALLALFFYVAIAAPFLMNIAAATSNQDKTLIYDDAHLLSQADMNELNAMANKYGAERQTDIIILTSENTENKDVVDIVEDFYDKQGPGYDKAHGNAVILTLDMNNRDVYIAGFGKDEEYLDDSRATKVREKITPYLSDGDYKGGFEKFIKETNRYLGFKPGVNPDNPLFNIWVQLGGALVIGALVVGVMVFRSGGRVTVDGDTYEDVGRSGVLEHEDRYIRTTVTKRKIEKNNDNSSGGGGGTSDGGYSHSGSRGSF